MRAAKDNNNNEKNIEVTANNSEIANRLKIVCGMFEGGADKLSEATGIARRTLGNYLSGRNEPKTSASVSICKAAGVSIAWFSMGYGPMLLDLVEEKMNNYDVNLKENTGLSPEEDQEKLFQHKKTEFGKKMHDYKDATIAIGYAPPILIREAIKTVMFTQGLTKAGAIIILNAMKEQKNMDKE